MSKLRPFIAACLAFLWMPLAMHCALEASGLFERHTDADSCCDADLDCNEGPCSLVSAGEYNPAAPVVKVAAPALLAWAGDTRATVTIPRPRAATSSANWVERPPDWVVSWHFVRRAAGSPRAPAPLV